MTSSEEQTEDDVEKGYFGIEFKSESQRKYSPKRGRKLFGVDLSPDIVAIVMVYFVQGVLGLSRLAVSFFLKDDLHLDPAEVNATKACHTLPCFSPSVSLL